MKKCLLMAAAVVAIALIAGPALADWYPWDPYKYKQLPDGDVHYEPPLGLPYPTAVAVDISDQMVADDFPCEAYGTVTKLHFWGNWEGGGPPNPPLQFTGFRIGFHTDIPAIPGQKPSQPGQELWMEDVPMSYVQTRARTWTIGHWYDPTDDPHWRAVQATIHEFNVDLEAYASDNGIPLFVQEGTRQQPVTYWLSLQGIYLGGPPEGSRLGWVTTSLDQAYSDDAAWIDPVQYTGGNPVPDPWTDMKYEVYSGVRHPWTPQSMNMSFVIVTRESMPIPEPAGLGLVGMALLALRRRRS